MESVNSNFCWDAVSAKETSDNLFFECLAQSVSEGVKTFFVHPVLSHPVSWRKENVRTPPTDTRQESRFRRGNFTLYKSLTLE
jgi:hypothetical protein